MQEPKKVTIYDLADALGISVGTVYRALHNTGRISPVTKERVLQKAKEMNFKANTAAQSLRRNPIHIGVILSTYIHQYLDEVKAGMEAAFRNLKEMNVYSDIRVLPETISDSCQNAIEDIVQEFKEKQYKAVILLLSGDVEFFVNCINQLSDAGILVATVTTDMPNTGRVLSVTPNGICAGKLAAELLHLCCPEKNIVILAEQHTARTTPIHNDYITGFMEIAQNKKFQSIQVYENEGNVKQLLNNIDEIIENMENCDGIYITSAISVYAKFFIHKLKKYKDIKIVTTDLFEEIKELMDAGLICATIYQKPFEQGYQVVQNLYEFICEGKEAVSISITPQVVFSSNMNLKPLEIIT